MRSILAADRFIVLACVSIDRPISVAVMPDEVRLNNGIPSRASRLSIRFEIVGCVLPSKVAALEIDPVLDIAKNTE